MYKSENFDPKLACKYCKSMAEMEEINGHARDEGLTYGQYVAKYGLFTPMVKTVASVETKEKRRKYAAKNADGYFVDPGVAKKGIKS